MNQDLPSAPKNDNRRIKVRHGEKPQSAAKILHRSLQAMTVIALIIVMAALAAFWLSPTPSEVQRLALGSDRILLAQDGQMLQTLRTDFEKRRLSWTSLTSFPEETLAAVIAAEDKRFRDHPGFDLIGLGRAAWAMMKGQRRQGASTITMQLSDLIDPSVLKDNQKIRKGSLLHKLSQIFSAVGLELGWTKNEILEAYLNLIHLRGEYQGVPAVSHAFLDKFPEALTSEESRVVAVMISAPNISQKPLALRACGLSQRMSLSCAGVDEAAGRFFRHTPRLPTSLGDSPHLARRMFNANKEHSILKSTVDLNLQREVTAILERSLHRLRQHNVNDSSAIVIDNKTGRVLAYVGSTAGSKHPHVDGIVAYRQAGSSLKPFLYTRALEAKTVTPASILLDDPTAISWGGGVYRPTNYDRHFYGTVSLREALAASLNVPAVKIVTIIGLHNAYQTLVDAGFTGLREPDFYGVSMALGAVEVRLEDLANAYRMLANGGRWTPLKYLEDTSPPAEPRQVFAPPATYLTASILSDPHARAIGFGAETPLETSFWTAVKTGTSKDYRDNWCVGFSDRYTVAVWAGNFDAQAMNKVSGVSGAGPAWFSIMNYLHREQRSLPPAPPVGVTPKKIRHQWESSEHEEYFLSGTEPAGTMIEPATDRRVQFVFPAEGSVLIKDPHMDPRHVALFVRFKGTIPEGSRLRWNNRDLGAAESPFKIDDPATGAHALSIVSPENKILGEVSFRVRGGNQD